jgi:hypothetical protein
LNAFVAHTIWHVGVLDTLQSPIAFGSAYTAVQSLLQLPHAVSLS